MAVLVVLTGGCIFTFFHCIAGSGFSISSLNSSTGLFPVDLCSVLFLSATHSWSPWFIAEREPYLPMLLKNVVFIVRITLSTRPFSLPHAGLQRRISTP